MAMMRSIFFASAMFLAVVMGGAEPRTVSAQTNAPMKREVPQFGVDPSFLFLLHSQLVDISPFRQRRSPHTCSSFTPPLHHQIHPWNRWFPLTLTFEALFQLL